MKQKNILFGKNIMNFTDGDACIIAEAGINHDGSFDKAKRLIDVAAASGCTCVKFQTFRNKKVNSLQADAARSPYMKKGFKENESLFDVGVRLEFSFEEQRELFNYAASVGIPFISSHFDEESLGFLVGLGVPVLKVASGEMTNFPLLKEAAMTGIPMIVSTGMASLDEIDETVSFLQEHGCRELYLMHCVSWYPAKIDDMNIRVIDTLHERYNIPVGLSDHTLGISVSAGARARGVKFFEKHFTISKNDFGFDHSASMEPDELAQMVTFVDEIGRSLGSGEKVVTPIELEQRKVHRKSVVAAAEIKSGTLLTRDMLTTKRPGLGIPPKYIDEVVGYTASKDIGADDVITWEMIEPPAGKKRPAN
jgi:sialic acid synthase SpsE